MLDLVALMVPRQSAAATPRIGLQPIRYFLFRPWLCSDFIAIAKYGVICSLRHTVIRIEHLGITWSIIQSSVSLTMPFPVTRLIWELWTMSSTEYSLDINALLSQPQSVACIVAFALKIVNLQLDAYRRQQFPLPILWPFNMACGLENAENGHGAWNRCRVGERS